MSDYTLPPVPDHPESCIADHWSPYELSAISAYGQACAEAVRVEITPRVVEIIKERDAALARIAELEQYEDMVILRCGELETFDEYRAAMQRDDSDRLRAEVDALTAANAALRADAERYAHLKSIAKVGITKRQEFVIALDLVPCPNHIGMLDLALDADRNHNNKEPTPG